MMTLKAARCVFVIAISALCSRLTAADVLATDSLPAGERISKLESIMSKLPKISGTVNLRYQYNGATDRHGFDLRRARLDVRGNIGRKLNYRLHVEFAGNPKILDAYLNWKINDYIALRAGEFKIPFSLENPYGSATLETMDNSLVISRLVNYSDVAGISANGRDIGLGFNGSFLPRDGFSIINYSLGVFNGSGINISDANNQKDFSGILTIRPMKNLSIAGYHYNGWGTRTVEEEKTDFRRLRSGGGVKYDDGRWLARGEYIWGKTGGMNSEGAYGVVGCFVHSQVQAVLKYDYFKRDLSDKDTRNNWYTVGVNYMPVKYVRLQLNYSYRTSPLNDYSYAGLQIIGIF